MRYFQNLPDRKKFLLLVKLGGFIEGAVLAARVQNVGLSEARFLTTSALRRESAAHDVPRDKPDTSGNRLSSGPDVMVVVA